MSVEEIERPARRNIGWGERIGSIVAGAMLIVPAFRRPSPNRILLALGGAALLQRGITGRWLLHRRDEVAIGRRSDLPPRAQTRRDAVLVASEDSFPASDPPAWTPVVGTMRRR